METETYELKRRIEPFILGKLLNLLAIFVGSCIGLSAIILLVPLKRRGLREDAKDYYTWLENNEEFILELIPYIALAIVLYYIFTKIRYGQVERFTFHDFERKLLIRYKNYFLHIPYTKKFSYKDLTCSIRPSTNLLYGDHIILTINHKRKRIVRIDGASADWQLLPKTLARIHEKIREIN